MAGIYIHIPFCRKACNYCDFHFSTNLDTKKQLIAALAKEISLRKDYLKVKQLDSIYFGGGTPSLLDEDELTGLFDALKANFNWDSGAEITLEANPDDITAGSIKIWKKLGINRLSIGLQSFNDKELQWMNRAHNAAQSLQSIELARDGGISDISIDLIYGSRFQDPETWKMTVEKAISLKVDHISAYNLTIEERTRLGTEQKKGLEPAVDEGLSSDLFNTMVQTLANAGYEQYEISNFARNGRIARHNSSYWHQQPYLGIGPSAHSFNGHSRQWNIKNNPLYIRAIEKGESYFETEELSPANRYNEYVMTRLRTKWGCSPDEIEKQFGVTFRDSFLRNAELKKDWLQNKNGLYVLNEKGKLLADGIASDFFLV